MRDAVAQKKFDCPACGAEAHWNPGRSALVCPFCGTVSPAQVDLEPGPSQDICELDLVAALQNLPADRRGWEAKKTSVRCRSCEAITVFDPERVGQRCNFCGSSALVPYEDIQEMFRPESLLPMKVSESQVREEIRKWYGSHWLAPNRLRHGALTDTVKGVYIPYWTFDARVHADWTADSGYYYYVTEHYTDAHGKRQTRRVRKVRWVPSSGSVDHSFDDELVCASRGIPSHLLHDIEPFPTKALVPYNAGFLAGWLVERYQIDLTAAATAAQNKMAAEMRRLCASKVPGDTHRNLSVRCHYSGQTFKHILVPVWLLSYNYGKRNFQVVINGVTGSIAGTYPKSWVKILFLVLAILAAVGIFVLIAGR